MIKPIIFSIHIFFVLFLSSCYVKYKVSGKGIKSNMPITGIYIVKIDSVLTFDENGIPDEIEP